MSQRMTRGRKRAIEEKLEEYNIGIPIDDFGCELDEMPYEPKSKNSKNKRKEDSSKIGWEGNIVKESRKRTIEKKDKRNRSYESSPESSPTYYRSILTIPVIHHNCDSSPESKRAKLFPAPEVDEMLTNDLNEPSSSENVTSNNSKTDIKVDPSSMLLEIIDLEERKTDEKDFVTLKINVQDDVLTENNNQPEKVQKSSEKAAVNYDEIQLLSSESLLECDAA